MRYEHLIEINNPLLPLLDPLDRDDLWEGLMLRAYAPQQFILGLQGAAVDTVTSNDTVTVLHRTLNYGRFRVKDTVTLHRGDRMVTEVAPNEGVAAGRLTITIEEPAAGRIYLRFLYQLEDEPAGEFAAMTEELRRQAYFASDMDTVARIRELAEQRRIQ